MTPCPTVAQSLEPSSAVVTKSLSLEDQVGAIPGAPKAALGPENEGIVLMRSELITKADRGFRGVESLRVRAHEFVQVAIACVQVDEEPIIEVIPGAESVVGGYTIAVVERDGGGSYRAWNRMVKIAPCVAASCRAAHHMAQTAGAVNRGRLQSPLRREVERIAPAERDAVVQARVAAIGQCLGNTITEHLTGTKLNVLRIVGRLGHA